MRAAHWPPPTPPTIWAVMMTVTPGMNFLGIGGLGISAGAVQTCSVFVQHGAGCSRDFVLEVAAFFFREWLDLVYHKLVTGSYHGL